MSPASHMVGRLREMYGIVLSKMRLLNDRQMNPQGRVLGPAPLSVMEPLEPRLLLDGDPGLHIVGHQPADLVQALDSVSLTFDRPIDAASLTPEDILVTPSIPVRLGGYDTSGYALGIAVSGTFAYVADDSSGLQIIDVSNPSAPAHLGGYDTSGYAGGVAVSGTLAYVADDSSGLQIIDVSNPSAPVRLGGYDTSGYALGIAVLGTFAYVADYGSGLQIVEVLHPVSAVTPVNELTYRVDFSSQLPDGSSHFQVGPWIQDTSGNTMDQDLDGVPGEIPQDVYRFSITVDSTPPSQPASVSYTVDTGSVDDVTSATELVFTWPASSDANGIARYDYRWDGGEWTATTARSSAPLTAPEGPHTFEVRAVDNVGNIGQPKARTVVVEMTAPGAPSQLHLDGAALCWSAASDANGIWKYQWRADGGSWTDAAGLQAPTGLADGASRLFEVRAVDKAGNIGPSSEAASLTVRYGPYITAYGPQGLVSSVDHIDLSFDRPIDAASLTPEDILVTPSIPVRLGGYDTSGYANAVAVSGTIAYVADGENGLEIIDVSNPAAPVRLGGCDTGWWAEGVAVSGTFAYVAAWDNGLQIIDVSNPAAPVRLGGYDAIDWAEGVAVSGTIAYVADGGTCLQIIDVSNPYLPVRLGSYWSSGNAQGVAISGTIAYVADSYSGLQIIDVSNPYLPVRLGGYDTIGDAYDVAISGTIAYVADGHHGIQIIDVSNPSAPVRLGGYDTSGDAYGVAISGTLAYVADDSSGLQIIDVSNPSAPVRLGGYDTSGDACGVAVSGTLAYVADYDGGLQIVEVLKSVSGVTAVNELTYRANFSSQLPDATYHFQVGPWVHDVSGNTMDQDRDGVPGEIPQDVYRFSITVDSTVLPTATVDLRSASDTGYSSTDNITNDNTPTLDFAGAAQFRLYRDGQALTADFLPGSSYTDETLTDGSYSYTVLVIDVAGNTSIISSPLTVTIDTAPPVAPSGPDLQAGSDLGISNTDNFTADNTPTFDVIGGSPYFRVYCDGTLVSGAFESGSYTTPVQPNGTWQYTATAVDAAGNESAASPALVVTISTQSLAAPEPLDLQAASDSGFSGSDNITNDNTPTFDVTVTAPYFRVYRSGTLISGFETGSSYTAPAQPDGTWSYTVKAADEAGNESPASSVLSLTLDTIGPRVTVGSPTTFNLRTGTLDHLTVTFSETIDFASAGSGGFTTGDVNISGPDGAIGATEIAPLGGNQYQINFAAQTDHGAYRATVGPEIVDLAGNLMNQNQNGQNGEPLQDQYSLLMEAYSADTVFISALTIGPANTTYDGQDICINGTTVTIDGLHSFHSIQLVGSAVLTHSAGSVAGLNLNITDEAIVGQYSSITANAKGYGAATGPGAGQSANNSGGGGFGGLGGKPESGATGGLPYGSVVEPTDLGSGGGNSYYPGGAGGGAIRLIVGGTLQVDGSISADGAAGRGYWSLGYWTSGGGSGGSIWISASVLTGSAGIHANGGAGGVATSMSVQWAGGGGGGRIALYYQTSTFSGPIAASGGTSGSQPGGAGTIFTKSSAQAHGKLLIDNGGTAAGKTPLVDGTCTFDAVEVKGKAVLDVSSGDLVDAAQLVVSGNGRVVDGGNIESNLVRLESGGTFELNVADTIASMVIASGGILTHAPGVSGFNLTVTGDMTVEPGGSISADAKGYGAATGPGAGQTSTVESGYVSIGIGGGGGYGGQGGTSSTGRTGGSIYGDQFEPNNFGSGGGNGGSALGGSSGGAIRLTVGGDLHNDGEISADGAPGAADWLWGWWYLAGGGGSGGSVWIVATSLSGDGAIHANGRAGGVANVQTGGGGAGGRIGIYYVENTFIGAISALGGGSGDRRGEEGTKFINGPDAAPIVSVDTAPTGLLRTPVDHVDVVFTRRIDPTTFTADDVYLWGPAGEIPVTGISLLAALAGRETYRISFPAQNASGGYRISIGPNITGANHVLLDQDHDGQGGEAVDDVYVSTFTLDTTGPRITRQSPAGDFAGTATSVDVWFSEPIQTGTLTVADIAITGPGGTITPTSVTGIGNNAFRIIFGSQTQVGQYHLQVGPQITDLIGNLMDQDRDNAQGQPDDAYQGTFQLVDVDLEVSNLAVAATELWANDTVHVSWTGANTTGYELFGSWTDAVYLSADDIWDMGDVLLATVPHTGGLASGTPYSAAADITIPGVLPGNYHIIVRTDMYGQEKEAGRKGNNVVASAALPLHIRPLGSDGAPVWGGLSAADPADYYALEAEAGRSFRILLDGLPAGADGQFFVTYEAMPTRLSYDYRSSPDATGRQQLALTANPGGTYYISVFAEDVTGDPIYSISATEADVIVSSISPDRHGVDRQCTMTITGAGFTPETVVEFVASDSSVRAPEQLRVLSPTTIVAVLGTPSWPEDVYDVVVSKPGADPWEAGDAFTVTPGAANFEAHLIIPGNMDRLWRRTIWIEYANTGDSSMGAPLLVLQSSDNSMLTLDPSVPATLTDTFPPGISDKVQVMARGSGATPGILQPGDTGRIPVYFIGLKLPWNMFDGTIDFDLDYLSAAEADAIDWPALKEDMQPAWIQDDAWDAVWLNFTNQVGDTWGEYVSMLDGNMSYLYQIGDVPRSITEMVAFEYRQADGLSPIRYLAASLDGSVPTPGLSVDFVRAYAQPISRRYAVGALGCGWTHSWQISLDEDMDGTVRIYDMTGTPRLFLADGSGGYTAQPGDNGTLTRLGAAGFELRERSGLLTAFYADGRLKYVQHTNANRITAGYSGALLTSLTHNNGGRLLLEYYPNGCLWRLIDPLDPGDPSDDRITTYEYDASGEYLLTVTAPGNRVTTYAYETGGTPQQRHALLSVEHPDGMHEYFSYDEAGRLAETHLDGGAEPFTYTYDSAGTVTVEDATGRQTVLGFGPGGQVGQVRDGEGNVIRLGYDDGYELRQITGGSGEAYAYTYDDRGNVTGVEDPLRRETRFTYTTTLDDLSSVTDARGNGMDYEYDAADNLVTIIYEDATRETFTYDSTGNVLSRTNRRGQTVTYTYDAAGQIASKDYPDTPEMDYLYTYDSAGNLLSATGPEGTTLMTYDADTGWLARIEYPGGRWFKFDYDNAGRRTKRTDQDGNVENYIYDAQGRLDRMTDGSAALIVDFDYDQAGRMARKTLGNGVYTTYEYDAAGQLLHLVNYKADSTVLSRFDYTYNASGQRTGMTTLEGTWSYSYDAPRQLSRAIFAPAVGSSLPAKDITCVYDAVGNRTQIVEDGVTTAYTTNSMNQYASVGAATYTFDADGNMTGKTEGGVTTTYTYDIENRLVAVITPTDTWTYTYDAFGQRIATTHNGVVTTCVVDPVGFGNVAAEYDSGGSLIARYDHGYGLVARTDDVSDPVYYTFDAMGSTSELTDETGVAANWYEYDPFGNLLGQSETVANPFLFVGEYGVMRNGSGFDFMRARFYDIETGRFVSEDPLGLAGGGVNLYTYASNDPVISADPSGLCRGQQLLVGATQVVGGIIMVGGSLVAAGGTLGGLAAPAAVAALYGGYQFSSGAQNIYAAIKGQSFHGTGGPVGDLGKLAFGTTGGRIGSTVDLFAGSKGTGTIFTGLGNTLSSVVPFGASFLPKGWFCGWTEDPPPEPNDPPTKDADDGQGTVPAVRWSRDPNDKLGPAGFGDANYVDPNDSLAYTIRFENISSATAPAHKIIITDILDEDLDLSTFELTEIGFAGNMIMVPKGLGNYQAAMDVLVDNEYVAQTTLRIQIDVSLDKATCTLTCTLMGLDPQTGWLPENIMLGILYPNDDTGRGDGHISYTVKSLAGLPSGTEITNKASIYFDWNDPIDTPNVLNTIDASSPTSSVEALTAVTGAAQFLVSWGGTDEVGGSGVAKYDVFVSDNGGAYAPWLTDTAATSATFTGEDGHTYAFYSRAKDNVGHVEAAPADPDAVTMIVTLPAVVGVELNGVPGRSVSAIDPSGMGVRTVTATFSEPVYFTKDDVVVHTVTFPDGVEAIGPKLTPLDIAGSGTSTMTITLADASAVDTWVKVTLEAAATADLVGNLLDGEAPDGGSGRGYVFDVAEDLPTGDGLPGGDAVFYVGSLRGDFNGDLAITAADKDGFAAAWRSGSLDADFRGVGFGPRPPDGRITVGDINGFTSAYQRGIAEGIHLDPLPAGGESLAAGVPEPLPMMLQAARGSESAGADVLGMTEAVAVGPVPAGTPVANGRTVAANLALALLREGGVTSPDTTWAVGASGTQATPAEVASALDLRQPQEAETVFKKLGNRVLKLVAAGIAGRIP